jgi:hypothetical protein
VKWTSFSLAVAMSAGLHLTGVGVLVGSGHWQERRNLQLGSAQIEFAPLDPSAEPKDAVAIAIEPPSDMGHSTPAAVQDSSTGHPRELVDAPLAPIDVRSEPAETVRIASIRATAPARQRKRENEVPSHGVESPVRLVKQSEVQVVSSDSRVDSESLRRAMKSAASQAASTSGSNNHVPMVRVDPSEKNLDRAWSRAFAWVFATDRSFFAEPPLGTARFVLELADDGSIRRLHWLAPGAPARLEALVQRMVKLLSRNRFSPPSPGSEQPRVRGFEMKVSATRVPAPKGAAATSSQAGDLWMLEAGEIPTRGQPSRPMVADMTGHQVNCVLRILDVLPELGD